MTPPVRIRAAVAAAPPYVPGRRPAAGTRVARLASNEVPDVLGHNGFHRYPEPTALDLRQALAARLGVDPDAVVAAPGSVALLRLLIETTCDPGDEVVFAWRSFEAYPMLTQLAGAVAVAVPLTAAAEHDLPAMAAAVTERTRMIIVCSPNNPTGTVVPIADLRRFLAAVPADVLVALDEAYVEFAEAAETGLDLLADHPNLLVLRTFSKAYGLAGARVGYGVADPALAGLLRAVQVPFAVAQPSIDLAVAALARDLRPLARETRLRRDAFAQWARVRGIAVPPAGGNFVWLSLGEAALPVAEALAAGGVLVRPFAGEGVRVTVGDEAEMAMLRAALERVLDVEEAA